MNNSFGLCHLSLLLLCSAEGFARETAIQDHANQTSITVQVDFTSSSSPNLDKEKFNVYNCPYFKMDRWFRDVHLLKELGVRSLRYDPTWGGHNVGIDLNSPQISGTTDNLIYNFSDFDRLTDSLKEHDVEPMYVMAYTPKPLQRRKQVWGDKPTSMEAWRKVCRDYAAHWRTTGRKVPWYEIWNEPDNPPFFFRGTMDDYFDIYHQGALGIKEGDPDAKVGGPVVAALNHDDSWISAFLDYVTTSGAPLDFLSYHNYGDPIPIINKARACLHRHPALRNLPMMMTEYNSYVPLTPDFNAGGRVERYHCAARLLSDFRDLLEHPDVTRVYWAMFNDPDTPERLGLVSLDGKRKAAFNAFRIYMDMPGKRCSADTATSAVQAMASADDGRAAAVLWSNSDMDSTVSVSLEGIPAGAGPLRVYRIDSKHSSVVDNPKSETLQVLEQLPVEGSGLRWNGLLPARSVVYFSAGGDPL